MARRIFYHNNYSMSSHARGEGHKQVVRKPWRCERPTTEQVSSAIRFICFSFFPLLYSASKLPQLSLRVTQFDQLNVVRKQWTMM